MSTMSERIQELITELDITKSGLAGRLERSTGNVSDWISGRAKPSKNTMKLICKTFNISYEWLSEGKGIMHEHENEISEYETNGACELTLDEEILIDMYREMSKSAKKELQLSARTILARDKEVTAVSKAAKSKLYRSAGQDAGDDEMAASRSVG